MNPRSCQTPVACHAVLLLVAAFFLLSDSASAGLNVWTRNGPYGGPIAAVAVSPSAPSILYAAGYERGVFRSTDSAATWSEVEQGLSGQSVLTLAIHPLNPQIVYAGTYHGVFKTTNGGTVWVPTGLSSLWVHDFAIDANDPQTLYAGVSDNLTTGGGVHKSTDGATTWLPRSNGLPNRPIWTLRLDPTNPLRVYAGTPVGVFRSTDGAASWTPASTGLPAAGDHRHRDRRGSTERSVLSDDRGALQEHRRRRPMAARGGRTARGHPRSFLTPAALYAAGDGSVHKSTDGALSWMEISTGLPLPPVANQLAATAGSPSATYLGTRWGLYKSVDAVTWLEASRRITAFTSPRSQRPRLPIVYAGSQIGILRSLDRGELAPVHGIGR